MLYHMKNWHEMSCRALCSLSAAKGPAVQDALGGPLVNVKVPLPHIPLPPELRRAKGQGRDVAVASTRSRQYEAEGNSIQLLKLSTLAS